MSNYSEIPFPEFRNNLKDFLDLSHGINFISGQSEVDITELMRQVDSMRAEGEDKASLIAYFIWALSRAMVEHPEMQAIKRKKKLILFNNVDVATMIEKTMEDGTKIPFPYIIRAAQNKSYADINAEITRVRTLSFAELKSEKKTAILSGLPKRLRMSMMRRALKNPDKLKEVMGTVGLTSIGRELKDRKFWPQPVSPYTCTMAMGSIYSNQERNILCVTMKVNHDLIDGIPAVKFARTFFNLLENPTNLTS
ncbi:MAG: pyruvate/2-oxoglutarate dehydrogenase complex dihydrolipoamide acyltransferase (E2) component [Flavobacteriaceae bacterium]|jgi:pyruvate/2-oxoglutarate dehydrogenase complex dihydrolipoamide acyltransferase (E2) component